MVLRFAMSLCSQGYALPFIMLQFEHRRCGIVISYIHYVNYIYYLSIFIKLFIISFINLSVLYFICQALFALLPIISFFSILILYLPSHRLGACSITLLLLTLHLLTFSPITLGDRSGDRGSPGPCGDTGLDLRPYGAPGHTGLAACAQALSTEK